MLGCNIPTNSVTSPRTYDAPSASKVLKNEQNLYKLLVAWGF